VLTALGLVRVHELVDEEEDEPAVEAVGWERPDDGSTAVWLVRASPPTTGLHLRFAANSAAEVETFFGIGVAAGGIGQAAPRRWPIYRRGEFGATLRDPLGNLIEVVAPEGLTPRR
jgi:hypothetical protein